MAMIAGLPKAPSRYNPVANPKRALERRNWIFRSYAAIGLSESKPISGSHC